MTDITDEMIDRAAQALFVHGRDPLAPGWADVSAVERDRCRGYAVEALRAGLAGRTVLDLPAPLAFQDEFADVKTWEPDGVDFQISAHPADCEKDAEVSFAYWRVSKSQARGIGSAFLAASEPEVAGGGEPR